MEGFFVKRFIFLRLFSSAISLLLFMTVLFFAVQALIPGDYVTQYVLSVSVEDRAELRRPRYRHPYLATIFSLA